MEAPPNTKKRMRVLMFPWLAHGHMAPFLELAKKLTERNFEIHFCSSPIILDSIRHNVVNSSINLVELNVPSLPDLPPHYHTTKNLPPHLEPTLKRACDMSSGHFSNILTTLKPDLLISDFNQPWAPTLASSLGIPTVCLLCSSASSTSYIMHKFTNPGKQFPFPSICYPDYFISKMQSPAAAKGSDGITAKDRITGCYKQSNSIILIITFEQVEKKYLDYMTKHFGKEMIPIGPLLIQETSNVVNRANDQDMKVVEWLNKKEKSSTLLVSFGSEYYPNKHQREEIACGLELTQLDFILVLRFSDEENKMTLEEALPQGFIERVGERGMVIKGWAPQRIILGHSSIGGFMNHCGCNSVMESLYYGVPIIAVPMQYEQPLTAKMLEDIGVGKEAKRDMDGNLDRKEIAKVIKEVMVESSEEQVRTQAREMSDKMKLNKEKETDKVVNLLLQVCGKSQL